MLMNKENVIVLDFGGQYSHLITRRIRDLSVYAELLPYDKSAKEIESLNPLGIILTGGPSSVYDDNSPKPDPKIFLDTLTLLGVEPDQSLYVGDQILSDIQGSKNVGITPLLIDRDNINLDYTESDKINSLYELNNFLYFGLFFKERISFKSWPALNPFPDPSMIITLVLLSLFKLLKILINDLSVFEDKAL